MKPPEKETFCYSLEIEEIPHTKDTVQYTLGSDYFNPDYSRDVHAREILNDLFRDAITNRLMASLRMASEDKETFEKHKERNDEMIEIYREIEKSLKLTNETTK